VDTNLASNVDISHLPTPDELGMNTAASETPHVDISHLPTPSELNNDLSDTTEPPQWSKAESFGQGALQGVTAGFSDELGGALGAGMEKLAGNPDNKSLKDLYKEYRDMHRQRNEQAHEQNPGYNLAGNITGAVGGAVLAPELMAPKTVAGGAILGGAVGLGTSQQDLTEATPEQVAHALENIAAPITLATNPPDENNPVTNTMHDVGIGTLFGIGGGLVNQKLARTLAPEALDVASSKLASKAVGIKPSKELARVYDPSTGKVVQGSDVIKGIGSTAMKEGVLPFTGGADAIYDKSLDAIDNQYKILNPIMQQTQQKLSQNLDQSLQQVGGIGTKAANYLYDFQAGLDQNPNQAQIMDKIEKKYLPYIQQLTNSDGNLQQLTQFKRALQDEATNLSAAAYDQPASDLKPEAEFVKNLGGIVRQHIEDLAGTVDPDAGKQIADTNKTLSNLYTYNTAAKKLMDKGQGSEIHKIFSLPGQILTGNPTDRLAKIATAKALNQTSKIVQTPAGELAQKAIVNAPLAAVTNPFTQGQVNAKSTESSKIATNLYNATDDSLKEMASQFKATPGLQFYGEHLDKALATDDEGEKNRAVFLIMQNPTARKMVTPTSQVEKQDAKALQKYINR
jgi:hypothetical protein